MFILINTAFEKVISLPLCKQKMLTSSSATHTSNYLAKEEAARAQPCIPLCQRTCQSIPAECPENHPKVTPTCLKLLCHSLLSRLNFKASLWGMHLWTNGPQTGKFRGKAELTFSFTVVIKSERTGEFLPLPAFRWTPPTRLNHEHLLTQF